MTNHDANVKIMLYGLEYSDPKKRSKWEDGCQEERTPMATRSGRIGVV